jgi:hypothetical protein
MIAISLTMAAFIELVKIFSLNNQNTKPRYGIVLWLGIPTLAFSIILQSVVIGNKISNSDTTFSQIFVYIMAACLTLIISTLKQTEQDASVYAAHAREDSQKVVVRAAKISNDGDGVRL